VRRRRFYFQTGLNHSGGSRVFALTTHDAEKINIFSEMFRSGNGMKQNPVVTKPVFGRDEEVLKRALVKQSPLGSDKTGQNGPDE
jgi:hypothetical protein